MKCIAFVRIYFYWTVEADNIRPSNCGTKLRWSHGNSITKTTQLTLPATVWTFLKNRPLIEVANRLRQIITEKLFTPLFCHCCPVLVPWIVTLDVSDMLGWASRPGSLPVRISYLAAVMHQVHAEGYMLILGRHPISRQTPRICRQTPPGRHTPPWTDTPPPVCY